VASIEVVGMVYKSPVFVAFLSGQLRSFPPYRVVANDPTCGVESMAIPHGEVYRDPNPTDHYLSRVYRCWNYCVESSTAEYVCLVNSDMAFSPGWLEALERRLDGKTIPCSRLVEPGFLRPGQHAIEIDLGRDPRSFPMDSWHRMAADLSEPRTESGGLFMPCVLHRDTFLAVGGYPEGNERSASGQVVSGDAFLFAKMQSKGFQHVTCFDSLVYHMQEGEMRHHE